MHQIDSPNPRILELTGFWGLESEFRVLSVWKLAAKRFLETRRQEFLTKLGAEHFFENLRLRVFWKLVKSPALIISRVLTVRQVLLVIKCQETDYSVPSNLYTIRKGANVSMLTCSLPSLEWSHHCWIRFYSSCTTTSSYFLIEKQQSF